jgi:hypothetical protein
MEPDSAFIIGSLLTIIGILIKDTFTIILGSFMVFITIVSYINTCRYNYDVIGNNDTNINSIEESNIEQL